MRLIVDDITASYGNVETLRGVKLEAQPGQVTCLMGRNGVGKTTLMKTVIGVMKVDRGAIRVGDADLTRVPPHLRARTGVALVPQGRRIFSKLTVTENLRIGLQARRDGKKEIPPMIYEMFPVLKEMGGRRGGDLSGGQQQQLAIGRALAGDPNVLLLDEPTEGIQPNIITQIGHVLRRLAEEMNMTIVLVEQYLSFVREFGHRFYIMNRGQIVAHGATDDLHDEVVHQHLSV